MEQLRAWWRASAILRFGQAVVDGLLERCRAAGKAIRARVSPVVDTALAAVDVAAIVFTVRESFARRHVLAEARRHLMETLRGRGFTRGLDDYIADAALSRHSRQVTVPQKGRRAPTPDRLRYTADFALPHRWWIAGTGGKPPRSRPATSGPGSPASPCRTRSAMPASFPARGTKRRPRPRRPPRTPTTTTTTRRRRTASTTRTGPPRSLRRSGPQPSSSPTGRDA
ncbi:hypothetical protein NKH18_00270 [Streptomyces sp. M10(2022)]